jgi:hypothetical protein
MDWTVHFQGTCKFLLQRRNVVATAFAVYYFSSIGHNDNIDS